MENKYLNGTGVAYLWKKIESKFASKNEIKSLASCIIEGYYYADTFYSDPGRTIILTGEKNKIYIDLATSTLYRFNGSKYITLTAQGSSGEEGDITYKGILETVLNDDYTLTIKFTDGSSYTTTSVRGKQGDVGEKGDIGKSAYDLALETGFEGDITDWLLSLKGETGEAGFSPVFQVEKVDNGYLIKITDADNEFIIELKDGDTGLTGNGISSINLNPDYTLLINYTDGTSCTTPSIRGARGDKGDNGEDGVSCFHRWDGTTLIIESANGTSSANLKGETGNSGVYLGSGDMPSDCNVQIDPDGVALEALPPVTISDDGKFLVVNGGKWAAVRLSNAEEAVF